MEIIKIGINSNSNFIFFASSANMNDVHDVHDVYEISSCITEFSIYHWSNVCWKLLLYISKDFRGRNIEKSERNNIHYCGSVFLVAFFVTVPAKFRPIEFLRSNREQLRYVHFAYSPLLYLSNIDLTPPIFFIFFFLTKILHLILHFLPDFFQYFYLYLQTF